MVEMLNVGEETMPARTLSRVSDEDSTSCETEGILRSCKIEEGSLISIAAVGRSWGAKATGVLTSAGASAVAVPSLST